jgi:hypothetical protein
MTLAEIQAGNTFKTETMEHIVLEQLPDGKTVCIAKDIVKRMMFDENTGIYTDSNIRKYLNSKFLDKLSAEVGVENIIEHTVDLTSDEGSKKYGSVQDKVSLLTCELFRKYHDILEKYNLGRWWWLATPIAEPGWDAVVRAVHCNGMLYCGYYYFDGGVRPFYILNSSISVS